MNRRQKTLGAVLDRTQAQRGGDGEPHHEHGHRRGVSGAHRARVHAGTGHAAGDRIVFTCQHSFFFFFFINSIVLYIKEALSFNCGTARAAALYGQIHGQTLGGERRL